MIGKDLTILHHNTIPFNRNNQSNYYLLHISKSLNHSLKSFHQALLPLCILFLVTSQATGFVWSAFLLEFPKSLFPSSLTAITACALKIGSKFHLIFFFHLILWCPAAVNISVPHLAQRDFTVTLYTPLISPVSF